MTGSAYRAAVAAAMGIEPERFERPGTTVCPADDRSESLVVSHYRIGRHGVLWCDPALALRLTGFDGSARAIGAQEFGLWAMADGAETVGSGFEHVLPEDWSAPARPAAAERLDGTDATTIEAVAELLGACPPDDLDDAEFDLDALDPFLVGWREGDHLLALAGGRPWAPRPGHHDLGVVVHPGARRSGLGAAVVAAVTADLLDAGELPLYRCNEENTGSRRLCRSVGYEVVAELTAYRWPAS